MALCASGVRQHATSRAAQADPTIPSIMQEAESIQLPSRLDESAAISRDGDSNHAYVNEDDPISDSDHGKVVFVRLYISHTLSTWNARLFEFGAVLFLAAIYPDSLQPLSIYALVRNAAAILLSQAMGRWIDMADRLLVVRTSIIGQRVSVAVSCGLFLVLYLRGNSWSAGLDSSLFAFLVCLACVEKLCFIMNTVSVERDWVVILTQDNESGRRKVNARIRRIDLTCKLVAPLLIALIDGFSTVASISTAGLLTILSVTAEYFCIATVYKRAPALRRALVRQASERCLSETRPPRWRQIMRSTLNTVLPIRSMPTYFRSSAFMPSFSLALLYLTVLSFAGQMITFLRASGYSSTAVGVSRTLATCLELSATWLAPYLMRRIGAIRTGLWSIYWEMVCLAAALTWYFTTASQDRTIIYQITGLAVAVGLSRIGLWGYDLSAQYIMQEEVQPDVRGVFSTTEAAFQNLFELLSYALTIAFPRPDQFKWPMIVSVGAVYTAGGLYSAFLRRRRGHLIHATACCKPMDEES